MAQWHLCTPLGASDRTCEADTEFWAKRKFAPIPKGWFVASDASYRLGFSKVDLPILCSKCVRQVAEEGKAKCGDCLRHQRTAASRKKARERLSPEARSAALRAGHARMSPEAKERKRERCRRATLALVKQRNHPWKENNRKANILRGIQHRAAKRQQLTLSL